MVNYRVYHNDGTSYLMGKKASASGSLAEHKSWAKAYNKNARAPKSKQIAKIEIVREKKKVVRRTSTPNMFGMSGSFRMPRYRI